MILFLLSLTYNPLFSQKEIKTEPKPVLTAEIEESDFIRSHIAFNKIFAQFSRSGIKRN